MKSYKIEYKRNTYWFSKEPNKFIDSYEVKFKDGEIACWTKYLHREDGPAVEKPDGTKIWCINGKLHREDAPAIECTNGSKSWYWHGKFLNVNFQEEFERWKKFRNFS